MVGDCVTDGSQGVGTEEPLPLPKFFPYSFLFAFGSQGAHFSRCSGLGEIHDCADSLIFKGSTVDSWGGRGPEKAIA